MRKNKYVFATIISAILSFTVSVAFSQEVNTVFQGSVPIYDGQNINVVYDVPLPEGKWFVRNIAIRESTGNQSSKLKDVRLGLIEDGKLIHSIEITAKINTNTMKWLDEPCKIELNLYKNDYGTSLWKQKCMIIVPQTFLQNDNDSTRQFLKTLADTNIKHDFNSIASTYTRYGDFGKFLVIRLHTFPSNYGLENPMIGNINVSPYHPSHIDSSKINKSFIEKLAKYSEILTQWYDMAYEGKKFGQLARFKYSEEEVGMSDELKDKLKLLEKSLAAKLITQAEFDQKKGEVLKTIGQP